MSGKSAQPANKSKGKEALVNAVHSKMQRPQRWDQSFDPDLTDQDVQWLLTLEPFRSMNAADSSGGLPLRGILAHDCRLLDLQKGDIIIREGDYGNSAFLILDGEALVSLKSLPQELLGRTQSKRKSFLQSLSQLWTNDKHSEVRNYDSAGSPQNRRGDGDDTRVFLQDIPRIIGPNESVSLHRGEIFGEISALTRTPRSATVVANSKMRVLEIRWQGLRDLMASDPILKQHVESEYRTNSLQSHLRELPLFAGLNAEQLSEIADKTQFETYGKFQWNIDYRSTTRKDVVSRILDEPLIVEQGNYVNGLLLIRNGFVRICRRHGNGIQTVAYKGKGGMFGLREIARNWSTGEQHPWALSLRAVGYVDILHIPVETIEKLLLPNVDHSQVPAPSSTADDRRRGSRDKEMDRGLLEFLVEERLTNGKQAMMIDLERCTRCDDCVRACASTHNNNPRFVRTGKIHDKWMIANACMHCSDPVCMIGCPTGAIGRDSETGNVMINDQTCIGCSTCANSCPYDNIKMVEVNDRSGLPIVDSESGQNIVKATKCDLCVDQRGGPACQRACPHDALVRIDLTNHKTVSRWSS